MTNSKTDSKSHRVTGKQLKAMEIRYTILSKLLIIAIAFTTGASIMIIEIAANRILAPWFGNSLYTWTSLIGIILLSLSLGYYLGGWFADRKPNIHFMLHVVVVSSILIFFIPFIKEALYQHLSKMNIVRGPIVASLMLFAFPGVLLGSVSPYAIRLVSLLFSDEKIGISAGSIAMFSTFGSVLGTFGAGFYLIPKFKLYSIFFFISIVLLILSLFGYGLSGKKYANKYSAINVSILIIIIFGCINYNKFELRKTNYVIYEKTTFYHRIRVIQKKQKNGNLLRLLYLDTTLEGGQYLNSTDIPLSYQRYWELSKIFNTQLNTAVFLGAGSFTMPEATSEYYRVADIDVIDIDPEVIRVGRKFFNLNKFPKINAISDDARHFLSATDKKYDLIFGDVFHGVRYVPAHLLTLDFFQMVKEKLNSGGVFMINIVGSIIGDKSILFESVLKTLGQVFEHSYVFYTNPYKLNSTGNIIIVSSDFKIDIQKTKNTNREHSLKNLLHTYIPSNRYEMNKGLTLSDNYNPVEYLVAKSLL